MGYSTIVIQLGSCKIGARQLAVGKELTLMVAWALMVHVGKSINVLNHINKLKEKLT